MIFYKNIFIAAASLPFRWYSRPIALLLVLILCSSLAQAQEAAITSGGAAKGSGGTVAYSVGQVVYTTNTGTSGTVSQGVQQAYEIYKVGITETALNISLSIFPNPTTDNLTLQIQGYTNEKLWYQLFDLHGKLVCHEEVNAQQTLINTADLACATYLLYVVNREKKEFNHLKSIRYSSYEKYVHTKRVSCTFCYCYIVIKHLCASTTKNELSGGNS